MAAGLAIQNADESAGNGSISSQRRTRAASNRPAASAVSVVVSSNQISAWLRVGTRSIHRWFAPKAKPIDSGPVSAGLSTTGSPTISR
ncbi:hypothetical protein BH20ACT5_BH20ACT5_01470 [soil metagenome]